MVKLRGTLWNLTEPCAVSLDSHRLIKKTLISDFVGEGTGRISLRSSTTGTMLRRPGGFARHSPQGRLVLARFSPGDHPGLGERSQRREPPFHRALDDHQGRRAGEATNAPWKKVVLPVPSSTPSGFTHA